MILNDVHNKVPLGILDWGIYPDKSDTPIIYLYYRPNGDMMLYRTSDEIEVNLTSVSTYDNIILFRFDDKPSICKRNITAFDAITLDVNKATYRYPYVRKKQGYLFILIPAIFNLHSVLINNVLSTSTFSLVDIYEHNNKFYFVYRTTAKYDITGDVKVEAIITRITNEQADTIGQVSKLVTDHIADLDDPHQTIIKLENEGYLKTVIWKEDTQPEEKINLRIVRNVTGDIPDIPIIDKQVILDEKGKCIYADNVSTRVKYSEDVGNFIKSGKIEKIEFIDGSVLPPDDDNVLYLEIPGYQDGIDFMQILDNEIEPPFGIP